MQKRRLILYVFFLLVVSKNSVCFGLNWSRGVIIYGKNDELIRTESSLIYDKQNRYLVAWSEGKPKDMKILVSVSGNGRRWSKPVVVCAGGENRQPHLFQSIDGMYRLVWSHTAVVENQYASSADLYYSVSADFKVWSEPAPFNFNSDIGNEQMPHLSQDTAGIYRLVWSVSNPAKTEIYYSVSTYFSDWTKPKQIETGFKYNYYPRWLPLDLEKSQIIFVAENDLFLQFIDDTATNLFRLLKVSGKKWSPQIVGNQKSGYLLIYQSPTRIYYSYLGEDRFFSEPKEIQVEWGKFIKKVFRDEVDSYPSAVVAPDGYFSLSFATKIKNRWSIAFLKQRAK